MAALGRKASETVAAAAALANPFTRRVAEAIASATGKEGFKGTSATSRRKNDDDGDDERTRCTDPGAPFGFLDNMCGPMLRNFNATESNDAEDLADASNRGRDRTGRGGGRGGVGDRGGGRRPTGSYDYDDETNVTDVTGSYEDDDETYDDESRRKGKSRSRGRDRKPRPPADSPSEMTGGYSEFDDDTTQADTLTEVSSVYDRKDSGKKSKGKSIKDDETKESEKLITQPLASGFAKRCYFTKAGIGRTTQHYEGLTLTGNTVLMLAAAMKLKGCPTICDEDLRRVEQTYPNQFSRLPDELLLSSGWRRISKYCHFSHKPLPDGVPFFHSRKRCHPNGGFYFLLCSAVGMTRLMDVEPLNRDALAVLQTDFPMTCEKAPNSLMEDPSEWTLVNKFCFFSGGPINVEEDVYYRAELGGTEIYMLAFLSPSLSPEELYRLKPESKPGQGEEDTGPLKSVAAVEEVESVYDLTERDFDDLKLYHLGPCRALPPYLLHPETWTKVLPPHFVAAREEALRIAEDWEARYPPAAAQPVGPGNSAQMPGAGPEGGPNNMTGESPGSGYVELGGAAGRPVPSSRGGSSIAPGMGPGYPPQYPGMHQQDPGFYPSGPGMEQPGGPGYPPQHQGFGPPQSPMDGEMNYYYGASPGSGVMPSPGTATGAGPSPGGPTPQFPQHHLPPTNAPNNPYGNPNMGAPSPDRMSGSSARNSQMGHPPPYDSGPHHQQYGNAPPQQMMGEPHWRDVQEEGAFGRVGGGDQPDDEAIATRGGMYGAPNGVGSPGMMHHPMDGGPMDPMEDQYAEDEQFARRQDPPDAPDAKGHFNQFADDGKSVTSGTSSLMGGAQNRLKMNRMKKMQERSQRPDLSTKLAPKKSMPTPGAETVDDSTWDTRTEGESSYGTSLVSGSSYTDATNPNERNSRRALILQMAKARMKNVKETSAVEKSAATQDVPQDELVDEVAGLELD